MTTVSKQQKNINNLNQSNNQNVEKNVTNPSINNINPKVQSPQTEPVVKEPTNNLPQKNLTIVRQASLSSQEEKQKKNIKRQQQKSKRMQQKAPIQYEQPRQKNPQKVETQKPEIIYDEYNVLKISGLLDAYEHFLKLLCKNGLPTGKIYDYAAQEILKYEKRKINKQLKMRAELDIQKILKKNDKSSSNEKSRSVSPYYNQ